MSGTRHKTTLKYILERSPSQAYKAREVGVTYQYYTHDQLVEAHSSWVGNQHDAGSDKLWHRYCEVRDNMPQGTYPLSGSVSVMKQLGKGIVKA